MSNINKKTALVTGVSSGLGQSLAMGLLTSGYHVYGVSRSNPNINNDLFEWVSGDLGKINSISEILEVVGKEKIDLLINNAGVTYRNQEINSDPKKIQEMLDINLIAPILITNHLTERLLKGLVINISSIMSVLPVRDFALYSSSKSGLNTYFKVFALDNPDIKIFNLLPDMMNTPMLRKLLGNSFADYDKILQVDNVTQAIIEIINKKEFISGDSVILTNTWLKRTTENFEHHDLIYNTDIQALVA